MKKNLSIFIAILLFSCNNTTTKNSALKIQNNYYFGKEYIITGKLSEQDFYGRPSFGEDPDNDELEHCYLITMDSSINILSSDTVNGYNTEHKHNQSCFQIVSFYNRINGKLVSYEQQYLKKIPMGTVISLKGFFDSAITGHDHTEVLFIVNKDWIPI